MKYLLPLLMMISVNCFGQKLIIGRHYIMNEGVVNMPAMPFEKSEWLHVDKHTREVKDCGTLHDSLTHRIDSLQSLCDSLTSRNDKLIKIIADLIEVEARNRRTLLDDIRLPYIRPKVLFDN